MELSMILNIKCLFCFSLYLLIWMNVTINEVTCEADLMLQMKNVREKIFKDYDKNIRPTNGTNTTEVHTYFIPRQIIDLDEDKGIFSFDSFFSLVWFDPRLKWDKSEYDGSLHAQPNMLWTPDISVYNSHSLQVDPTNEVKLFFESDGWVFWFPPVHTQTSCASVSPTPYPKDEVECEIILGSWISHGWEIDFKHYEEMWLDLFVNIHPRWELILERARTFRNDTFFECCPEPYISLHVVLPMRRRPVPAIEATRPPCMLVMVLTLAIFWLPPDSSKKLVLGGFLFVVLNVLLVYVGWNSGGTSVLFGVSFLQTTMYLVVATILLQVLIVIKMSSQSGPARPPSAITHILTGPMARYACLSVPLKEDDSPDRIQLKPDSSTVEAFTARDEWRLLASATDRALFVLMALVMISVHHL